MYHMLKQFCPGSCSCSCPGSCSCPATTTSDKVHPVSAFHPNQVPLAMFQPPSFTVMTPTSRGPVPTDTPSRPVNPACPTTLLFPPTPDYQQPAHQTFADMLNCGVCEMKDGEITTLQTNLNLWRERAWAAEERLKQQQIQAPAPSFDYRPNRGLQIPKCEHVILNLGDRLPPGYQLLCEWTRLAVPVTWYSLVMGKTKEHTTTFCQRKVIDGFFSPEDFGTRSPAQFKRKKQEILQAIEVFGIRVLHLLPSQFSDQLSRNICSLRKAYRNLGAQHECHGNTEIML